MKSNDGKKERLLASAYKLFTEKEIKSISIQEIVDDAGIAKGTFYLYFKDKYELRDVLIIKESEKLFNKALEELRKTNVNGFADQIIFILDYVIDELKKNPEILNFMSKNLSWGIYSKNLSEAYKKNMQDTNQDDLYNLFVNGAKEQNINLKNPEVTLFMIIELVSSTCFDSILNDIPLPINEYKPLLYEAIKKLLVDN